MASHVAAVINLILDQFYPSTVKGVSPPPLPSKASYPYVTVHEVSGIELENIVGPSGLVKSVVQVNCWDVDYERGWQARKSIQDYLSTFSGDVIISSAVEAVIHSVNHVGTSHLYDGDREVHQLITRLSIWLDS